MSAAHQLSLLERSFEERFQRFHRDNPEVYRTLVRLARDAKAKGLRQLGIRCLWERMRWELTVEVRRQDGEFRLNDHLTSRYARLLQEQEPDLAGFFHTRTLRSA